MARVLVVGYGPQAAGFAARLAAAGQVVRLAGPEEVAPGERVEVVWADPYRLATLSRHLAYSAVGCWLLGEAPPDRVEELAHQRLPAFVRMAVDAGIRGIAYQPPAGLERSAQAAERICAENALGFVLLGRGAGWEEVGVEAVGRLIGVGSFPDKSNKVDLL